MFDMFETFKEPKVLPCIHTFCHHCLEKYGEEKKKEPGENMDCPLCRKLFEIPQTGFKGLPNNYFIIQLLEVSLQPLGGAGTEKTRVECELCFTVSQMSPAVAYCIECGQDLCEICASKHKSQKFGKMHKFVNLDEKPAAEKVLKMMPSYCEQHLGKEIELYCYDCDKAFCMVCYVDKHNTHKCSDVKKSAQQFYVELDEDIAKLGLARCQEELKELDKERCKFITRVEASGREIGERYKRLRAMLDENQKDLIEELMSYKEKYLKEFEIRKDEVERMFVTLESLKRYCSEMRDKGTPCEISRAAKALHARTEELLMAEEELMGKKLPSAEITLMPSTMPMENGKNWIGELSYNTEKVWSAAVFLTQATIHRVINSKMRNLRSIAVLGSEMFVAGKSSAQIEVYDTNTFTLTRQIPVPGSAVVCAMAACSHYNCLYVSTADAKAILHRFDLFNNSMSKWTLTAHCSGLSISRSFNLIASLEDKRIQEYTTQGILIRTINICGGFPYHCVQLSSGEFVVAKSDHKVWIVGSTGQHLELSYGSRQGSGDDQLIYPYQLSVDKSDNVIVADYKNSRIVLLSPTLTLLGYIPIPGDKLVRPRPVHLDTMTSFLHIGECDTGRVIVLKTSASGQ